MRMAVSAAILAMPMSICLASSVYAVVGASAQDHEINPICRRCEKRHDYGGKKNRELQCPKCAAPCSLSENPNSSGRRFLIDSNTERPHICPGMFSTGVPLKRGPWNMLTQWYPADLFKDGERNPAWHNNDGFFIGRRKRI
jgi:hypothetical protein